MTVERRQKIERIFHDAAVQPASQRDAFLNRACGHDSELRGEIERLLSGDALSGSLLQIPADKTESANRLSPGDRLGPYEIVSLLGAGGMGEVYKARDPRLDRSVAIKVLPRHAAGDSDRRKQLLREARAASALSHPNIVTIHDVLSEDGMDSIVMEHIEGSTLVSRTGRGGLPIREALDYAIQIGGALAAAHAAGIVHRDLKPQNVMVTDARVVKVLDFGLAKLAPAVGPEEATATMTAEGVVAGTFLYMSPEQAEGRKVDSRSDIFAFGSLLYEILTGRPAFPGDSRLAIVAAILHRDPPSLSAVRRDLPLELEKVVQRCLRKDPAKRMQSMQDVRLLLEELRDNPDAPVAAAPLPRIRFRRLLFAALALTAGALLALLWLPLSDPGLSSYRLTPFATEAGEENSPAWSPDGRTLAYEFEVDGVRQIYTRGLDASSGTRVTSSSADCVLPFWSPDGSRIYYQSAGQLWSVGPAGGIPRLVAKDVRSAAASPDGKTMALVRGTVGNSQLWTASPVGADPKPYRLAPFSDKLAQISGPQFAPDGSKLAVGVSRKAATAEPELWILPFPSGPPNRVPVRLPGLQGGNQRPSWMPDSRHLILSADHHLYAIDSQRGDLRPITSSTVLEVQPAVSPDGRRIAFAAGTIDSDIVQIALDGSPPRPLLATSRDEREPAWSPVSSQYAYVTTANGPPEIWLRGAQDTGARPLVRQDATLTWNDLEKLHFSPDGRRIAFDLYGDHHVVAISDIAGGRPVIPDQQSTDQHGVSWSPDGNWIAYRRLNGSKWELVKRPLGGGEPVWLEEAAEGGAITEWSPSGEWICHPIGQTLRLISADGSRHVVIQARAAAFSFSRDSGTLYAIRRNSVRKWELAAFAVPSAREIKIVTLDLPASARVTGFSLDREGNSFVTSVGQSRFDIWFLEGFAPRGRWFFR